MIMRRDKLIRFVVLLFVVSICSIANGQEREYRYGWRGYYGTAKASYLMWEHRIYTVPAIGLDVVNGYSFNQWFMLGGGVGVVYTIFPESKNSFKENLSAIRVPMYLQLRANIIDRRVSPTAALNLGGGFCKGYLPLIIDGANEERSGSYGFYYIEPQVGVSVRLYNGQMVDFGISMHMDIGRGVSCGYKFGVGFTW